MAGSLADAVGELRLSDAKIAPDFLQIQRQLLRLVENLERDASIELRVEFDAGEITEQVTDLRNLADSAVVAAQLELDTEAALQEVAELGALADNLSPLVIAVQLDTASVAASLAAATAGTGRLLPNFERIGAEAGARLATSIGRSVNLGSVLGDGIEVRLSDEKLRDDAGRVRENVVRLVSDLERDAAVKVTINSDARTIDEAIGRLQAAASKASIEFPPGFTAPTVGRDPKTGRFTKLPKDPATDVTLGVEVDPAALAIALAEVQRRASGAGVQIPVHLDTDDLPGEVGSLERIVDNVPPVAVPLTVDATDGISVVNEFQRRGDDLPPIIVPLGVDGDQAAEDLGSFVANARQSFSPAEFERVGGTIGQSLVAGIGRPFQAGIATLAATAAGFLATALVKGFQRLTTIQDATASLTVALGDAGAAAAVLDDVLNVVIGTPFNLDQFARAAANLISFGVEAEKVPRFLTAIGEAAATRGSQANEFAQRLSSVFGQVSAIGRISGEDVWSFAGVGVNALAILGNTVNKTTEEMRDLISKGAVPAEFALEALSEGILNGTDGVNGATLAFTGTMERLRETLTGAIGGFGAATARFGANFVRPLSDIMTQAFSGGSAALDKFGKNIEDTLGDLAQSPALVRLRAFFVDLPNLVEPAAEVLGSLGPALAPLTAAFGAFGLQRIASVLGPLGGLIPTVSSLTAALVAFIATTPEIRDQVVPAIADLAVVLGEFVAVGAVLFGDFLEQATPLLGNFAEAAADLVPIVKVVGDLGIAIGAVLVPALGSLASILASIPTGALTALFAGIAGTRLLGGLTGTRGPLGGLTESLAGLNNGLSATEARAGVFSRGLNRIGVSAVSLERGINSAAAGIGGAFAGMAIASEDAQTRTIGALGGLASVAAGFAAGGPIGAGVAGLGVVVGTVAGQFVNASREAAAFKREVAGLAESVIAEFEELAANLDAVELLDLGKVRTQLRESIGDEDLLDLDKIGIQFQDLVDAVGTGVSDVNKELFRIDGPGVFAEQLAELERLTGEKIDIDLSTKEGVQQLFTLKEAFLTVGETQLELEKQIQDQLEATRLKRLDDEEALIRRNEISAEEVRILQQLSGEFNVSVPDLIEGDPAGEIDKVNTGLDESLGLLDDATNKSQAWADMLSSVSDELDDITSLLDKISGQRDVQQDLAKITAGLGEIVNQDDLDAADDLADDIERQQKTVDEIRKRLASERADASVRAQNTLARIAEAEAAGAVLGAAGLRRELEHDQEKTRELEAQLQEQVDILNNLKAELAQISTIPVTLGQQLAAQAQAQGISIFELLIAGTTPEAEAAFDEFLKGPIDGAVAEVNRLISEGDISGAQALADQFTLQFGAAFTSAFGADTANLILTNLFNFDDFTVEAQALLFVQRIADTVERVIRGGTLQGRSADQFERELAAAAASVEVDVAVGADTTPAEEDLGVFQTILDTFSFHVPVIGSMDTIERQIEALETQDPVEIPVVLRVNPLTTVTSNIPGRNPAQPGTFSSFSLVPPLFPEKDGGLLQFFRRGGFTSPPGSPMMPVPAIGFTPQVPLGHSFVQRPGSTRLPRPSLLPEQHIAQLAPVGTARIWREPETLGEAYLPLAPSKRPRAISVFKALAEIFEFDVTPKSPLAPVSTENIFNTFAPSEGRAPDTAGEWVLPPLEQPTAPHVVVVPEARRADVPVPTVFTPFVHPAPPQVVVHVDEHSSQPQMIVRMPELSMPPQVVVHLDERPPPTLSAQTIVHVDDRPQPQAIVHLDERPMPQTIVHVDERPMLPSLIVQADSRAVALAPTIVHVDDRPAPETTVHVDERPSQPQVIVHVDERLLSTMSTHTIVHGDQRPEPATFAVPIERPETAVGVVATEHPSVIRWDGPSSWPAWAPFDSRSAPASHPRGEPEQSSVALRFIDALRPREVPWAPFVIQSPPSAQVAAAVVWAPLGSAPPPTSPTFVPRDDDEGRLRELSWPAIISRDGVAPPSPTLFVPFPYPGSAPSTHTSLSPSQYRGGTIARERAASPAPMLFAPGERPPAPAGPSLFVVAAGQPDHVGPSLFVAGGQPPTAVPSLFVPAVQPSDSPGPTFVIPAPSVSSVTVREVWRPEDHTSTLFAPREYPGVTPPAAMQTVMLAQGELAELTAAVRALGRTNVSPTAQQRAARADLYDRGVTMMPGAITLNEVKSAKRTVRDLVDELSRMALG